MPTVYAFLHIVFDDEDDLGGGRSGDLTRPEVGSAATFWQKLELHR